MTLIESCTDCDWSSLWEGGKAADDPAIEHAKETGHKVKTRPVENLAQSDGDGDA